MNRVKSWLFNTYVILGCGLVTGVMLWGYQCWQCGRFFPHEPFLRCLIPAGSSSSLFRWLSLAVPLAFAAGLFIIHLRHENKRTLLQRSEAGIRELMDSLSEAIFEADTNGRITFANRVAFDLFGYTREDFEKGVFVFDVVIPDDLPKARAAFAGLAAGNPGMPNEYTARRKDGRTFPAVGRSNPIFRNGQVIGFRGFVVDLSDRRQVEDQIRFQSALLDQVHTILIAIDNQERIIYWNKHAETAYQWTAREAQGRVLADLITAPEDRERARDLFNFIQQGNVWTGEVVARRKDGTPFSSLLTVSPLRDSRDQIIGQVGHVVDISERRAMEAALRESEARYRAIVQDHTELITRFRSDGTITFVNEANARYFGCPAHEMVGRSLLDQIPVEDRPLVQKNLAQLTPDHPIFTHEHRAIAADASVRWQQWTNRGIFDAQGTLVEVQGIGHDVTERKQAEEALRASESKLKTILSSIGDLVFGFDREGRFAYYHAPPGTKLLLTPEQFLGKHYAQVLSPPVSELTRNALEMNRKNRSAEYDYALEVNGQTAWFSAKASPMFLADEYVGSVIIIRDTTERKHAEEQIHRYSEHLEELVDERTRELQRSNASLTREMAERKRAEDILRQTERLAATGHLAARIAHEINNPLAGIKNSFQLIKTAIPASHPYYSYVGLIEREINRIADIIRQMFDLYRPEQDSFQEFRICDTVAGVVALLEPTSREYGVTLAVDDDVPTESVLLSESLLRQVLFNLLKNAIEASPAGKTVRVSARLADGRLVLAVADHGPGIPADIRSRIFEPFFTTKSGLKSGGLGLGLAITRSIVESMGGVMEYDSSPDHGTTFKMTLPLYPRAKEAIHA